jgi:hypothetical protein
MINMIRNPLGLIAYFIIVFVGGCDAQWSPSERDNLQHFVESIRLINEAHAIANSAATIVTRADFAKIVALYQQAFEQAKLVSDSVLAKANPELPNAYRRYFQKGIELCVSSWTKQQPFEDFQGDALLDKWGDWLDDNHDHIDFPR